MRNTLQFAAIIAAATVPANAAVLVTTMSQGSIMFGFAVGVLASIVGSTIVNTCNARTYGRRTYEDVYFREESDMYWQDPVHADGMRRDRVRRHAEAPVTFPAGEPL